MGNIASVTQNGKLTAYTYDKMGQLIRVNDQNDLTSGAAGTTWAYEYDRGGNILNKKRYAYTTGDLPSTALETILYGYDTTWKDKLISYNGTAITYDAIGNPLSNGEWNYQWENGRRLWQMYKGSDGQPGSEFIDFLYNADGLRVGKQRVYYDANGVAHLENTSYTLHGKNIVHLVHEGNNLHFWYDASGKPAVVEYNGVKYGYLQNLQGDIVGVIDSLGNEVVKYTYDAWGKPLSCTGTMAASLGKLNPFRYRGYVFDEETGLYYLRSRYFSPQKNRFINSDIIMTGNLFAYCQQNPVANNDKDGKWGTSTKPLNVLILIDMLYTMLKDGLDEKTKWLYAPGQKFRRVDCIGMICYCAEQHFTKEAFGPDGYNVKKGTKLARDYNMCEDEFTYIRSAKHPDGVLPDDLIIGCTLYYESDRHVGIYVGAFHAPDGKVYKHGVIHSSSKNGEVRIEELEDTGFVKACTFNYINYELPKGYNAYQRYQVVEDDDPWHSIVN